MYSHWWVIVLPIQNRVPLTRYIDSYVDWSVAPSPTSQRSKENLKKLASKSGSYYVDQEWGKRVFDHSTYGRSPN